MAIKSKDIDLLTVVGLVAANAREASETVVQGARAHRNGRLSLWSKCAVEVDDRFHRRCPLGQRPDGGGIHHEPAALSSRGSSSCVYTRTSLLVPVRTRTV